MRRPGRLMRFNPLMTGCRSRRSPMYFKVRRNTGWGLRSWSATSKLSMKPSSRRIPAMAAFIFDEGRATTVWPASIALRMRVNISAIGSVTLIRLSPCPLPAGLHHARDHAFQRLLAEADAAHGEAPDVAARPTADATAVAHLHFVTAPGFPNDDRFLRHAFPPPGTAPPRAAATGAPALRWGRWSPWSPTPPTTSR